jgi:protein SPT2
MHVGMMGGKYIHFIIRRGICVPQRPNDATLNPKQPVKPHEMTNKRVRDDISSPAVSNMQDHRPKKRMLSDHEEDDCEGEKALLIIRKMFNTKRFAGRDDREIQKWRQALET